MECPSSVMTSTTDVILGGEGGTYDCAFCRSVSPWLVVAWEDTQMASTNELLIVQTQDRVVGVEEVRVEDHLDAIRGRVEQLHSPDLIQDGVTGIVRHIVRGDWWQSVPLEREDPTLEKNLVFF